MNAMELLTGSAAQAIGWALLHLLWQATIVAAILAAVLALLPRQSANARYAASCGALALVFAMFVTTAIRSYDPAVSPIVVVAAASPAEQAVDVPLRRIPIVIAAAAAASWRDRALDVVTSARQSLPTVVALWFLGVLVLTSRLGVSWFRARALLRRDAREASADWQHAAARISQALGLTRTVRLLESAAVEVPSVLGSLRPVILLPVSTLTGLTPQQIEMVLAHELAHIRRHDFFVNLLQAFVETLMFYHPAVWWMSSRVRIERENCCDDLAVAVCGNAVQYARALTRLEELRGSALSVTVAANGGSLLERIRRIAAGRAESTGLTSRWAAAVAMLLLLGAAVAVPSLPALAQRETPKPSETRVDVVESTDADSDSDPDADPDADPDPDPDPVANVDVDVDPDVDFDFDFDPNVPEAPETPELPPGVAAPAPPHAPHVDPMHGSLSEIIVPVIAEAVAMAPRVSHAALAALDEANIRFDDDDHDDHGDHGDDDDDNDKHASDRKLADAGKLTIDELISLRAVGVTPEYINAMRAIFPELTVRQVTSLKAVDVDPQFVRDMRAAGIDVRTARDATSLKAVGVTPEFIREMRAAGFAVKTAREASSLSAVGVTAKFVTEMRAAGIEINTARDATSMSAVGVTPQYIRDMRAAGVAIKTAREASSLSAVGVTTDMVKRLADAGYTNLSVRELTRLAAAGVDGDFIREMEKYKEKKK